jgi:hypothetical protein
MAVVEVSVIEGVGGLGEGVFILTGGLVDEWEALAGPGGVVGDGAGEHGGDGGVALPDCFMRAENEEAWR